MKGGGGEVRSDDDDDHKDGKSENEKSWVSNGGV
jgi:hypothetical protein